MLKDSVRLEKPRGAVPDSCPLGIRGGQCHVLCWARRGWVGNRVEVKWGEWVSWGAGTGGDLLVTGFHIFDHLSESSLERTVLSSYQWGVLITALQGLPSQLQNNALSLRRHQWSASCSNPVSVLFSLSHHCEGSWSPKGAWPPKGAWHFSLPNGS